MARTKSFPFEIDGKEYVINVTIKQHFTPPFGVTYTFNINNQNEQKIDERYFFDINHRGEYITKIDGHWIAVIIKDHKSNVSLKISVDGIYLHNQKPYIPLAPTPKWFYIYLILFNTIIPAYRLMTSSVSFTLFHKKNSTTLIKSGFSGARMYTLTNIS